MRDSGVAAIRPKKQNKTNIRPFPPPFFLFSPTSFPAVCHPSSSSSSSSSIAHLIRRALRYRFFCFAYFSNVPFLESGASKLAERRGNAVESRLTPAPAYDLIRFKSTRPRVAFPIGERFSLASSFFLYKKSLLGVSFCEVFRPGRLTRAANVSKEALHDYYQQCQQINMFWVLGVERLKMDANQWCDPYNLELNGVTNKTHWTQAKKISPLKLPHVPGYAAISFSIELAIEG